MKRLKMGVLVLMSCLFLTACGCSREEFLVTFDSNGGTTVESQTVEKGGKVTKPTDPEKEGYTFDGWYIDLDDEEAYDFGKEVTSDLTLEAKWVQGSGGIVDNPTCDLTCDSGYELDEENCKCVKIEETIVPEISSISLSKSTLSLTVGGTATVTATVRPSNVANKTVTWKSSNTKVATVSNGKITAIGEGTATITATAGGKSATVKVTVISKDKEALNAALNSITAKTITKGNTNINYTYSGCVITNTKNVASNSNTTVTTGLVKSLYRATSNGYVSSTYNVVCGSLSETKTVKHIVPASTYTYTADFNNLLYIIKVSGAANYTLSSSKADNLKYFEAAKGAQTVAHEDGIIYNMVLDSDANTVYAVKAAN